MLTWFFPCILFLGFPEHPDLPAAANPISEYCLERFMIENSRSKNDLISIVETVNSAYQRQPFNRMDYPRITKKELEELLRNKENQLYVMKQGNMIVGTVVLCNNEISMLSVHPNYQKQGLGLHLLRYAEKKASTFYDEVFLKVIPLFQEKLLDYYRSLGYRSCGEYEPLSEKKLERIREEYLFNPEMRALILRKNCN